jgi:hypothetical protein
MSQPSLQPGHKATYKTPRWIKISGIVALIVIVLLAVALLRGEHGPGRHMPSDVTQDGTPAVNATSVHTSPVDHGAAQP